MNERLRVDPGIKCQETQGPQELQPVQAWVQPQCCSASVDLLRHVSVQGMAMNSACRKPVNGASTD